MGSANLALIQVSISLDNYNINQTILLLPQVQGIVVGCLAALLAMAMAWLGDLERVDLDRMLELTASSVITASAASFILGQWNMEAVLDLVT